jgi:hypothetical protein
VPQLNKLLGSILKYYLFFSLISEFKISRVLLRESWNKFLLLKCCMLWLFSTLLHDVTLFKYSLRSPPPLSPPFPDECNEAGPWGSRVFAWRLTGMPSCIFITRHRVAKKYSIICAWVFGLFIGVFVCLSNLVPNFSPISEQYKKNFNKYYSMSHVKRYKANTDITMEWAHIGRGVVT